MADSTQRLFVHARDESPRMFKNNFLDFMSRIHPYSPLVVYLPIIGWWIYLCIFETSYGILPQLGMALIGIFAWTFMEYFIHRFVFHYQPTSKIGKRIHFITHGVHHDYPQDSTRLVFPPVLSLPLAVIFYFLFRYLVGVELAHPLFVGFLSAYLFYDMMHYAIHHLNIKGKWFRRMKKHHMDHHYKSPNEGYGFTSKLWDKVFNTDFKKK